MKRIISGIVFLPLFVALVHFGTPLHFFLLLAPAVIVANFEYFSIIRKTGVNGYPFVGAVLGFLLALNFYFDGRYFSEWMAGALFIMFTTALVTNKNIRTTLSQISYSFLGVLYVAGLLGYLQLLRNQENGGQLIFLLFLIVWLGDTVAYYIGKTLGKTPLAPTISPNKTVEGAVGGLLGSLLGGGIAYGLLPNSFSLVHCLIVALICGMIGQLGDLSESLLKRNADTKDSGSIIPGHGGLLDRLDSLMFAGPVLYFYYQWIIPH